jgi:hypothetical protein
MNNSKFREAVFKQNNFDRNTITESFVPNISYYVPKRDLDGPDSSVSASLGVTFKELIRHDFTPVGTFKFLVDSKNRIDGVNSGRYSIRLPSVYNVYSIDIINSDIPNGQYLVDASTVIIFKEGTTLLTGNIQNGDYTNINILMAAVTTSMNNSGNSNYTWSISQNNIITISSDLVGGSFSLDFTSGNIIKDILGFRQNIYTGGSSYSGFYRYNLTPQQSVRIYITNIDPARYATRQFGNSTFCKRTAQDLMKNQTKRAEFLDIVLLNNDGTDYNPNGLEHSLLLNIGYLR